jgi:hypothetical protein
MKEKEINPITPILTECASMQLFLDQRAHLDEPDTLLERLTEISTYLSRSGVLLADAKQLQDNARIEAWNSLEGAFKGVPALLANKVLSSHTAAENYAVNWLDRINSNCVHQSENLRTIISYLKQQASMGNYNA